MAGKKRSEAEKVQAITLASVLGSSRAAAAELGIPERTIREWVATFKAMGDSELEAFVAEQKRLAGGLWAVEQIKSLEFAQLARETGKANDYKSIIIAAGVCSTKLETLGQPKLVDPATSGHRPTIDVNAISEPSTPIEAASEDPKVEDSTKQAKPA